MKLWKITYLSVSTLHADSVTSAIKEICDVAVRHNSRVGITGILTFHSGNFAQILEGPECELRELMTRITADPRHRNLKVITGGAIKLRRYPDWSMAYCDPKDFLREQIEAITEQRGPLRVLTH